MTPEKVLIVEDDPTNRKLLETILRRGGFTSFSAVDGENGVEIARRETPDLILMDLQLPKMDGLEATRLLRAHPALSHTPIVAVTGRTAGGVRDEIMAAGCNGYITKPIDARSFLEQVRTFLKPQA